MFIYLTSEKNNVIFDFLKDQSGQTVKKFIGDFNFQEFVSDHLMSYDSCRYLAVDLECIDDYPDGFFDAVDSILQYFNFHLRLIVVSFDVDGDILAGLYKRGVFNIITGTDKDTVEKRILKVFSQGSNAHRKTTSPRSGNSFSANRPKENRVGNPARFLLLRISNYFFVIFWKIVSLSSFFVLTTSLCFAEFTTLGSPGPWYSISFRMKVTPLSAPSFTLLIRSSEGTLLIPKRNLYGRSSTTTFFPRLRDF